MSFDYFVAVHRDRWPTAKAVQENLERLGYPLTLSSAPDQLFSIRDHRLFVNFEGRPVAIEATVEQATDIGEDDSLFGLLAEYASHDFSISNGDYFLVLTFRSDADEIRAGLYLAAAMILSFDGYGFENQFESHGASVFAERLLEEASDTSLFDD